MIYVPGFAVEGLMGLGVQGFRGLGLRFWDVLQYNSKAANLKPYPMLPRTL